MLPSYIMTPCRSALPAILRPPNQNSKRLYPFDDTPPAIKHLRYLDTLTMQEDRQLHQAGISLINTAANSSNWASSAAPPATPAPTGTIRHPSSSPSGAHNEQHTAKRQITSWEGVSSEASGSNFASNHPVGGVHSFPDSTQSAHVQGHMSSFAGQQALTQHVMHPSNGRLSQVPLGPAPNQPSPTPDQVWHAFNISYAPPSSGHAQAVMYTPYQAQQVSMYPPEYLGQIVHLSPTPAHLAPPTAQPIVGHPQVPPQISIPADQRGPPLGSTSHMADVLAHFSNPVSSSNVASEPASTSARSGTFVTGSSSHPGVAARLCYTFADPIAFLSSFLLGDPMTVSSTDMAEALRDSHYNVPWTNWEKQLIVHFCLKPGVRVPECLHAVMTSTKSPRAGDLIPAIWGELSQMYFAGRRDAMTILQQWWLLVDAYCRIIAAFAIPGTPHSAESILERIYTQFSAPRSAVATTSPMIKVAEVAAWVEGGMESWFALAHPRLQNDGYVVSRIAGLLGNKIVARPVRRNRHKSMGLNKGGSAVPSSTPPAPLTVASAPQLGQMSHSSEPIQEEPLASHQPSFPPNLPGIIEMVRDQNAVTKAAIELAAAKVEYVKALTEGERIKTAQCAISLTKEGRELQHTTAIRVLESASSPDWLRNKALNTLDSALSLTQPALTVDDIVTALKQYLPGTGKPAANLSTGPSTGPAAGSGTGSGTNPPVNDGPPEELIRASVEEIAYDVATIDSLTGLSLPSGSAPPAAE
ncbi:hypothetical protein FRC06_011672 [Ceratobasidium sp. 370]|nr:hypothetical protein FRC06_011672 [Ceratobasidium sp. 370]